MHWVLSRTLRAQRFFMNGKEVGELYFEEGVGPFSDYLRKNGGILVWNKTKKEEFKLKSEKIQNNTSVITGLVARMGIHVATGMAFLTASIAISGLSIRFAICAISCFLIVLIGLFGNRFDMSYDMPDYEDQPLLGDNHLHISVLISIDKDQTLGRQKEIIGMMTKCVDVQLGFVVIGMVAMLSGLIQ